MSKARHRAKPGEIRATAGGEAMQRESVAIMKAIVGWGVVRFSIPNFWGYRSYRTCSYLPYSYVLQEGFTRAFCNTKLNNCCAAAAKKNLYIVYIL